MHTVVIIIVVSVVCGVLGSVVFDSFRVVDRFRERKIKNDIRDIEVTYEDISAGDS